MNELMRVMFVLCITAALHAHAETETADSATFALHGMFAGAPTNYVVTYNLNVPSGEWYYVDAVLSAALTKS